MQLGRVVGNVVATRKDERLVGFKLMIVQPLGADKELNGTPLIAVDTVSAGIGELVLFVVGTVAPYAVRVADAPVDAAIVAIVDTVEYKGGK
ncbi:MAG: EutN/CcmL family microcompartment protein [Bacillota bacterium]